MIRRMSSRGLTRMPSPRLRSARCIRAPGQDRPGCRRQDSISSWVARAIREDFLQLLPRSLARPSQQGLAEHKRPVSRSTEGAAGARKSITLRKPPFRSGYEPSFEEDDGIVVPRVYPTEYSTGANLDDGPARRRPYPRQVQWRMIRRRTSRNEFAFVR